MTKEFVLLGLTEERGWYPIAVSKSEDYIKEVCEFEHESQYTLKNPTRRYLTLGIGSYEKDMILNFEHARYMMDQGHIVRMCVNPEKYYRMGRDGETYVSRDIVGKKLAEYVGCDPEGWHNAAFFSRHIVGDWVVCDGEVPTDGAGEEADA